MEPLSDAAVRTLVERYAETVDALEIVAGEPLLVLPNAEFFPDKFTGDAASVERLAARMQGYAGLESVNVEVNVNGEVALTEDGCGTGGCGSGACATPAVDISEPRLKKSEHGWHVSVPAAELGHPIVLTSRLATAFGAVALVERHPDGSALVRDAAEAELAARTSRTRPSSAAASSPCSSHSRSRAKSSRSAPRSASSARPSARS